MRLGLLVGYFPNITDARRTLWMLEKHRFFKAALLHKKPDGNLRILDPFLRRRSLGLLFFAASFLGLYGASTLFFPVAWMKGLSSLMPLLFAAAAISGLVFGWLLIRRSRYGIDASLLSKYSKTLMSEETVLLLQAKTADLHLPLSLILVFAETHAETSPVVFIKHKSLEKRGVTRPNSSDQEDVQPFGRTFRHQTAVQSSENDRASLKLLKRIRLNRKWVQDVCADLTAASRVGQGATGVAEWIIDNEYMIVKTVRDILLNLPRRFYSSLPIIVEENYRGRLPYTYCLAKDIIAESRLHLTRDNIVSLIAADQEHHHLTIAELWALPQMLRIALIESIKGLAIRSQTDLCESQNAAFWANRLITANNRDVNLLFSILAELSLAKPRPSPYFGAQLLDHLYDETDVLVSVQSWLERTFDSPPDELLLHEQKRQASDQLAIGNAFTSLRRLIQLDWKKLFEQLNCVEQVLRKDPSGVYPDMDFTTRDSYRQVIEEFAKRSGRDEQSVARTVVKMAEESRDKSKSRGDLSQVGYYLVGNGRTELARRIRCNESIRCRVTLWVRAHHCSLYLSAITLLTGLFIALIGLFGLSETSAPLVLSIFLLSVLPASQLAVALVNHFIIRLLPTRPLPKMNYRQSGIPYKSKTLVVVPTLLINDESIREDLEKIEIRYMANREKNLLFSLFTDFTDSFFQTEKRDDRLIMQMVQGVTSLNKRYGNIFLLFHRERSWSESEQKFIGWERKRGKLEQLNELLDGTRPDYAEKLIKVGNPGQLKNIRFVITLDSDTQLPHGTARMMIETLAHPLNKPRFDSSGKLIPGTYTIIQPRVTASLLSSNFSLFSRQFSDSIGVDPYSRAISDAYQDLSGEGSYHGKGIYDVHAFHRLLANRIPEDLILSHDLLEGAHARVGLASDIELYDEFPPDYLSYAGRLHRWIRGDWQIAVWLLPWVPLPAGKWGRNPLSLFSRWKVFDNLRRSLVPVSSFLLLVYSWMACSSAAVIAILLIGLYQLWPLISRILDLFTTRNGLQNFSLQQICRSTIRTVAEVAMMPHLAMMTLGAIFRVFYRLFISHRHLLEWRSSQIAHYGTMVRRKLLLASLISVSCLSAFLGWLLHSQPSKCLMLAAPFVILWFVSPLVGWLLTSRTQPLKSVEKISVQDRNYLRSLTRRTWRYFDDFVNAGTSWLPPDNYQVSHQDQVAMRTSPTNIGLWMLSLLGARDCGYVSDTEVIDRLSETMSTLAKLEKFKGHLLNWYDISNLQHLEPRYVSSVDSGNLLAAIWVLENGLKEMQERPVLDLVIFSGFIDCGSILQSLAREEGLDCEALRELDLRLAKWSRQPRQPVSQILQIMDDASIMPDVLREISGSSSEMSDVSYWCEALSSQIDSAIKTIRTYLGWVVILLEVKEENLSQPIPSFHNLLEQELKVLPSLSEIGNVDFRSNPIFQTIRDTSQKPALIRRVVNANKKSRLEAVKLNGRISDLKEDLDRLGKAINMRFLYDSEWKLFAVGYNVSTGRLDSSFYDLLASEARLGSFAAIARGEIPMEHWFAMGRPHAMIDGHRVLMSWSGSMFEYLMPLLLQRSYDNSLLHRAVTRAVDIQIHYGMKQKVPWGMSESAYGNLDINKAYQYMAFGVPALGLKRLVKSQLVVAPYATMLALGIRPKKSIKNLRRLENLGLYDEYGFYESVDFSRKAAKGGGQGVIVKAYMAHHQAMGFLSLINFLQDDPFRKRFHADVRVKAFEPLLLEKIPTLPPLQLASTHEKPHVAVDTGWIEDHGKRFTTPHTSIPKSRLLSNGSLNLMLTNTGGGYTQWNGLELTRWRSDRTADLWGSYLYLYEEEKDRIWSAAYHPVGRESDDYEVEFSLDRVTFTRTDFSIRSVTDVIVSPEDDVEIRRLSLTNQSDTQRKLNLTSYFELSMAEHNADRQHPAFNKLFIQTEALPDSHMLLAYRRSRTTKSPEIFVAHRIAADLTGSPFEFETDRSRFIGRGNTLARPSGAISSPGNSQGFVLDPILSLRRQVTLEPNQRCEISFILAVAQSREKVIALADKYIELYQIDRVIDFAWRKAQIELRMLHIQPEEARWFQQLANHLLFPNQLLRAPADQIEENRKGQSGLWPYGISGDLPIILVTIAESRDLNLIRQLLQAHSYLRTHGFSADLLILNEEEGGYEQPLRDKLINLIQAYSPSVTSELQGNILLRSADQIPEEDLRLMKAAAGIILVAARGEMAQQLGVSSENTELAEPLKVKKNQEDPVRQLPDLDLIFFNGIGGFTPDGREYVITLSSSTQTPSPWVNVMANPAFGTMVSESGSGFTWFGNSQRNRLTQWTNDPVLDTPSEVVYLRDEQTGNAWTTTSLPVRNTASCRVRHSAGYTLFERHSFGLGQELCQFVPNDDNGGSPVKFQQLTLHNDTDRWRELSVFYYVELTLGEHRETSQMHTITHWDRRSSAMLAYNHYHPEYGERVAFVSITPTTDSYTGDRTSFIGRNRSTANPSALKHVRLDGVCGARLDPCASLQTKLKLAPGESKVVVCMLGQAESKEEACNLVDRYRIEGAVQSALDETISWWDRLLGGITVQTPDTSANLMINRWLLYQSLSCRIWGRSAFYQSGGAFGFRDQLQDVTAFMASRPELAREQILLAASRQFREGDVQHWWHPPSGAGIRSRISDDLLWLPYVVAHYVRVTGDVNFLNEEAIFLNAPLLEEGQHEVFSMPEQILDQATLFEHCRLAVSKGLTSGPNGLPLFGAGDWNDGMNLVGIEGKGESVWLGWFLIDVLQGMIELSSALKKEDLVHSYSKQKETLRRRIEKEAWDGKWYLRGRFDDGRPLGSAKSDEAQIDSLPQSWAWLSGAADPKRAEMALESAWQRLVLQDEKVVLLFEPPFDKSSLFPGYIRGYPPGVRENGGQYTHGALWFAMAMARKGDGERAVQMLNMMNPIEHSSDLENTWKYGIEPYVVPADVYRLSDRVGKGGWSWYTGSAAWMYRAWIEEVLGLKRRKNFLVVDPVIPASWAEFSVLYRFEAAEYQIVFENPDQVGKGVASFKLDGEWLQGNRIPLVGEGNHQVQVRMGKKE
jgi:cyclic beta-1,2-glucan glucanotransferase